MLINIIAVARIKENYINEGIKEYLKRLSQYCSIKIKEVEAEKIKTSITIEKIQEIETEKLLKLSSENAYLIALDEKGKEFSSTELAEHIQNIPIKTGKSIIDIIIGGANGLSYDMLKKSGLILSLSKLTFTHQMIRMILLEQLYRSFKIINNEPYHK